jgi:hypothetical protein
MIAERRAKQNVPRNRLQAVSDGNTEVRIPLSEAHPTFKSSTEAGMEMETSKAQTENADLSILVNAAPPSNVTCESAWQVGKHDFPRICTVAGIHMEANDAQL